ncbi:MAG: polymerase III, delta subunit protein [Parcubacteria group bacterium GW2011_GWC2_42_12]|nr:MAG: polymerase III, delta subunit protein [Parcubacteria group bacterium GW2011_GWC2_42_12]
MIVFLYGEDNFRSRVKLNELKDKYFKEVDKLGSGLKVVAGAKATFFDITSAISPASLLSKKRLIVIEDIFASKDQTIFEKLPGYLKKKELSDNIIIFWESNIKMKKIKSVLSPFLIDASGQDKPLNKKVADLFKFLAKQKYAYNFNSLSHTELANWVRKEVASRGGKISVEAAAVLVGLVGSDGWQISQEIDKLLSFKAAGKLTEALLEISAVDVKNLTRGNFSDNIFALTDALSAKNKALAIKLLAEQIEAGLEGPYLLNMFVRQFRILLQLRQAVDSGLSPRQIATQMKLHPFVLQKGLEQAKNFNLTALKNIFSQLAKVDYLAKSGQQDYITGLNILIARM